MTDSKKIKNKTYLSCVLKQEEIKNSKDYYIKKCIDCGDEFYYVKYGSSTKRCCKCRFKHNNHKAKLNFRNKFKTKEGFPKAEKFQTREELNEYLQGDGENKILCLECGHWFEKLSHHLTIHDLTVKEYKKKYGIPYTNSPLMGKRLLNIYIDRMSDIQKNIPDEEKTRRRLNAVEIIKQNGFDRNETVVYNKERAESAKKGCLLAPTSTSVGKKIIFPCSNCGEEFEASYSYAITNSCRILCGKCSHDNCKEYQKSYAEINKERIKEYQKKYRKEKAEKIREYQRKWKKLIKIKQETD